MNTMTMQQIEVDLEVFDYLKRNAVPFKDTPNSVLRKLLGLEKCLPMAEQSNNDYIQFPVNVPKALEQILQVINLVKNSHLSRIEATHQVAKSFGIAPQTVMDKYARQLGRRADEIDFLIHDDIPQLQQIIIDKFPRFSSLIRSTFDKFK